MTRKTRYWVCDSCGRVYNRRKKDDYKPCWYCGRPMRKARVYPSRLKAKVKRRNKIDQRKRAIKLKRHSVLRTAFKSRLRVSTPTKKAWRHFLMAKQRRTFLSRGQKFLDMLFQDIWSCPHYKGYRTNFKRGCSCSGGGMMGAPKLKLESLGYNMHGEYNAGLRNKKGFCIVIDYDQEERVSTLLHESTHWIDSMARITRDRQIGSHSKAFFKRMEDLARQLKYDDLIL